MGTSWNVLKVKRDMNRAIDSCDIVAFENAAGAAGNLQELHGTVAHGERMLRYLSAKPCRVHIGAPENPGLQTHLDTPQSEEHLYSSRRRTMEEASKAALSRQKRMEALEAPSSSSARRRGVWHEARHVAKVYNSQRRSVEFAITAGPGCCHGALPAASLGKGRRADASWWSDKCQSGEMMRMQSQELI